MVLRVGVAGLVHDHVWSLLKDWEAVTGAEIAAIAEPERTLWDKVKLARSQPRFHSSWQDMLDAAQIDAVMITTPNNAAWPIVEAAAARGLPIMLEKPLAASLEDGQRIYDAGMAGGAVFFVNWFTHWDPAIRTALMMASRGDLGRIQYFRFRIGHAGPKEIGCAPEFYSWLYDPVQNGGGALADFGGYGACMAAFLLGEPLAASGVYGRYVKTDIAAEDNGLVTLRYDQAVAVCEGSWSQVSRTQIDGPIIHGDVGSVSVADGTIRLVRSLDGGTEIVAPTQLPDFERSGPAYFAHCIATGIKPNGLFDPLHSLVAQKCIHAGLQSGQLHREVAL